MIYVTQMDLRRCHTKFETSQPERRQAYGIAEVLLIEVEFGGCALAPLVAEWT